VSAPPSVYEGRLVRLRAFEPEDMPLLHGWMNDTEVQEHQGIWYPRSRAQVEKILARDAEAGYDNLSLAIVNRADGRLIGDVGLHGASAEDRSATGGITIGDKSLWDGGYGTDAMRVICRVGFKVMNLHRIELHVFGGNARARHVYRKLGFVEEAICRDVLFKHGHYIDDVIMSLLAGELVE
jgi:RimJ/RimL family protein N-acetyltransferase